MKTLEPKFDTEFFQIQTITLQIKYIQDLKNAQRKHGKEFK